MRQSAFIPPGSRPPNYVNPPTNGTATQITNAIFAFLVFVSTVLRIYTRTRVSASFGLDDLFAVTASVCISIIPDPNISEN